MGRKVYEPCSLNYGLEWINFNPNSMIQYNGHIKELNQANESLIVDQMMLMNP